ncbi:unnamed protein product, partial [Polarella glacialis]
VIPLLARNAAVDVAASGDLGGAEAPSSPSADLTSVKPLWWGDLEAAGALTESGGSFDVVLCCEVVYQQPPHVLEALQATLQAVLTRPGGRVVFAYQHRDGAEVTDARFFDSLAAVCGLDFEKEESLSQWDGVWDDIDYRWVRTYKATVK